MELQYRGRDYPIRSNKVLVNCFFPIEVKWNASVKKSALL